MSILSPTAIHSVDAAMGLQTSPLSLHLIGSPDMPVSLSGGGTFLKWKKMVVDECFSSLSLLTKNEHSVRVI